MATFNDQQLSAVEAAAGPLLIDAGPGSGKTQTMAGRTGDLIKRGAEPGRILLLTFTKSGATELVERVKKLCGIKVRWSGTFHSICARLLRDWGGRVGLRPGFVIYDDSDQEKLIIEILVAYFLGACRKDREKKPANQERAEPPGQLTMVGGVSGEIKITMADIAEYIQHWSTPDKTNRAIHQKLVEKPISGKNEKVCREIRVLAGHLGGAFDWAKNENLRPKQFAEHHHDKPDLLAVEIYPMYEDALLAANAVDFGSLMLHGVDLLTDIHAGPDVRGMWDHVLVDEFQDTNKVQQVFLKGLEIKSMTVVGDCDQSLYTWRSARPEIILNFEKEFDTNPAVVKLEQNYRSTGHIIKAASILILSNKKRRDKTIFTDGHDGNKISIVRCGDSTMEGHFIAKQIIAEQKAGTAYGDVAVLYRIRAQRTDLEKALRRFKIPYKILGDVRFYDRSHVKDLLAYMRVLSNPDDAISLKRISNVPSRGISDNSVAKIVAFATHQDISLTEAFQRAPGLSILSPKARNAIDAFVAFIDQLKAATKPSDAVRMILERTEWLHRPGDNDEEEMARKEDLQSVLNEVIAYEQDAVAADLPGFMDQLALSSSADDSDTEEDVVRLMTCHASKGREFPIVFVTGLEQSVFPSFQAVMAADAKKFDELEEERRACFVAITRAKVRLFMTYCGYRMIYGKARGDGPSMFLDELVNSARSHLQIFNYTGDGIVELSGLPRAPEDDDEDEPASRYWRGATTKR